MSPVTHPGSIGRPLQAAGFRFGHESVPAPGGEGWSVEWTLRRNCSMAPRTLLTIYGSLCGVSMLIALMFWHLGATMVMPFAWLEMLAVGAAILVYGRHAADRESICLRREALCVECACGRQVERVEFRPEWVRVEPELDDRSLIELSGQGRRVAIGRFVRPELRRQLADELRWALRRRETGAAFASA
jgi:uncharacterized membrane protein